MRQWHHDLGQDLRRKAARRNRGKSTPKGDGSATVARCYRILHAVMETAVEDDLIAANPCRVKGGGTYDADERPTLTAQEVEDLVEATPKRYRALVYVLAWGALRLGEATELRRSDLDLDAGTVRIDRAVYPVEGEGYVVDKPKSRAGRRTVNLPAFVITALRAHMREFTDLGPQALVFPTRSGTCSYGAAQTAITRALRSLGHERVTVHDLRHTGQTLAAMNGATLADLMARLGHSTVNAAMRYAHASSEVDRKVADRMGQHRAKVVRLRKA